MTVRLTASIIMLLTMPLAGLCQGEAPEGDAGDDGVVIFLRAHWPGHDLSDTAFRVFCDPQMRQLVDVFPGTEGSAAVILSPGDYYVMAVADENGNNVPDAGDGIGFSGMSDGASRPDPVRVAEDGVSVVDVPIVLMIGEDGRPVRIIPPRLGGTISGAGDRRVIVVLLPEDAQTRPFAAVVREGEFVLHPPGGSYVVVALVDADADGNLSPVDLAAARGTGDEPRVVVAENAPVELGPLSLSPGAVLPEGLAAIVAGKVSAPALVDGAQITVAFCTDSSLRDEAFTVVADEDGRFAAVSGSGVYYLRTTIDCNGDGVLGSGDMLGFYGVADLLGGENPSALDVPENALLTDVEIAISATIGDDGRLTPWTAPDDAAINAPVNVGE